MSAKRICLQIEPPLLRQAVVEQVVLIEDVVVTEAESEADALIAMQESSSFDGPVLVIGRAGPLMLPLRLGVIADQLRYLLSVRTKYARRAGETLNLGPFVLRCGDSILLHTATGTEIRLTDKERFFLEALHDAGPVGLDRKTLLAEVWGYAESTETHTLETHLYRLRQKLEPFDSGRLIATADGLYKLDLT